MLPHVMNHEDVLKAALTCDYDITLRAFRRDPLVTCSKDDADKLLHTMIANTKKLINENNVLIDDPVRKDSIRL